MSDGWVEIESLSTYARTHDRSVTNVVGAVAVGCQVNETEESLIEVSKVESHYRNEFSSGSAEGASRLCS